MAQARKYQVTRPGSGWGIWESVTDKKVMGFGSRRIAALEAWYELEGWKKPAQWY